jgi:hypothetical protein
MFQEKLEVILSGPSTTSLLALAVLEHVLDDYIGRPPSPGPQFHL